MLESILLTTALPSGLLGPLLKLDIAPVGFNLLFGCHSMVLQFEDSRRGVENVLFGFSERVGMEVSGLVGEGSGYGGNIFATCQR